MYAESSVPSTRVRRPFLAVPDSFDPRRGMEASVRPSNACSDAGGRAGLARALARFIRLTESLGGLEEIYRMLQAISAFGGPFGRIAAEHNARPE